MFKDNKTIKNILMMLLSYGIAQLLVLTIYLLLCNGVISAVEKQINMINVISGVFFLFWYYVTSIDMEDSILERLSFKYISKKNMLQIILLAICFSTFFWSISKIVCYFNEKVNYKYIFGIYNMDIISLLSLIIFIPIIEEIIFRGFLCYELKAKLSIEGVCIIQALIFAVMHGGTIYFIFNFVLGLILGVLYHWTNSLHGNILFYIFYEFMGTLVLPNVNFSIVGIFIFNVLSVIFSILLVMILYKELRDRLIKDSAWKVYS